MGFDKPVKKLYFVNFEENNFQSLNIKKILRFIFIAGEKNIVCYFILVEYVTVGPCRQYRKI